MKAAAIPPPPGISRGKFNPQCSQPRLFRQLASVAVVVLKLALVSTSIPAIAGIDKNLSDLDPYGSSGHQAESATAVNENDHNHIAIVSHNAIFDFIDLFVSTDGGQTFSFTKIGPALDGQTGARADPSVAIASDSTIYVGYVNGQRRIIVAKFPDPRASSAPPSATIVQSFVDPDGDKPYLGVGPNTQGTGYNVYISYTVLYDGLYLSRSWDKGATFQHVPLIGQNQNENNFSMQAVWCGKLQPPREALSVLCRSDP